MAKVGGWASAEMVPEDVEIKRQKAENYPVRRSRQTRKERENKDSPTVSEMLKAFVNATSLNGIRYVFWKRPLWARIGWLAILLGFTGYFLFSAHRSIIKYVKRPINTVITQKYENELEFPAVTICPLNLISKKKLLALDDDATFVKYDLNDSFCSATAAVRNGKPCGAAMMCCCLNLLFFDASAVVPNCDPQYARSLIAAQNISGQFFDTERYFQKYAQRIEEILVPTLCVFDSDVSNQCGTSDFISTATDWGMCYTFNGDPDNVKKSQISGHAGGLTLLLDAQTDDQTIGRLSEGFTVIIHRQGESFSAWDGINISPGTYASINLHQQRIINLEDPYETKCKNKTLKSNPTYTKVGCISECLAEKLVRTCQCRPAEYEAPSLRSCAKLDSSCLSQTTVNFEPLTCDCPNPCRETRFTTEVHFSRFPDAGSAAVLQADVGGVSFEHMRNNYIFLRIAYNILGYELHEQKIAFGTESPPGETGRNMGLFLGCSLMTIFELADLLIALIYVHNMHGKNQM
ncbi:acid-sensing ion channel 5-like isoform X1 [Acropora millepora]|uniref:acid-sensing ion channel 5-like isoform X1 n=1 Tax=Acropora millepora TaxID=45264 RepID=UPI001CF507CD|nr:acid-sensing ion channel 5-like isoform X1 [Acropora millepora]XP_029191657.2 acid-sensing ion channel 5-like isoform X1 [Acropora millepora]XP_029191658.2 acid-sensing ion channel 5-like isoform X1 [Acropora millepora]